LIEEKIRERFYKAIIDELEKDRAKHKPDENKVSVTELVLNCPRAVLFNRTIGDFYTKFESLIRFYIGRKIHETPILSNHELELSWNGITGIIDEYENGILIEKKTTIKTPSEPRPHNVLQAEYYKVLLERNDYPVIKGFILYFNIRRLYDPITVYEIHFRDSSEIEAEMLERKKLILQGLKSKDVPPRNTGWICKYCDFVHLCYLSNEKIKKILEAARTAGIGRILFEISAEEI